MRAIHRGPETKLSEHPRISNLADCSLMCQMRGHDWIRSKLLGQSYRLKCRACGAKADDQCIPLTIFQPRLTPGMISAHRMYQKVA